MNIFYKMQQKLNLRAALVAMVGLGITLTASAQAFVQVSDSFPNLNVCSSAWGDIDNDGDMDVALSGTQNGAEYFGVWVNNGGGSFSELPSSNFTGPFTQIAGYTPNCLAWGDYNNDSKLDLAIVGHEGTTDYAKIWRNEGSNNFFNSFDLPCGKASAVTWADVDNDGDQDFVAVGIDPTNSSSTIWMNNHNQGSNTFQQNTSSITGFTRGACDFGDYDNDGDLDLVICGYKDGVGSQQTTEIYDNDGAGMFTKANITLLGLGWGDLEWTDVDADGDLDLMMVGFSGPVDQPEAQLLLNTGNASSRFDTAVVGMTKVGYASASLGDFNHDGYPDLILQGDTTGSQTAGNWAGTWNPSLRVMFPDPSVSIPALAQGSIDLVDYDADGDLDIFSGGLAGFSACNLFENIDSSVINTPPSLATGLSGVAIDSNTVEWTWTAATDDVTPAAGLSYRILIERQSDFFLLSPSFSDFNTEQPNIQEIGNIKGTSWRHTGISLNENYCATVIAVDAGNAASGWATTGCASMTVGMDDAHNLHTLNAWPNPATDLLNVSLEGLQGSGTLKVVGLDGRVMHSECFGQLSSKQIDISMLSAGMYFLSVQMDGQQRVTTLRFIKN